MAKSSIIKNASSAYGYNYASLADIVKQGFEIPKMRVKPTEYGDYLEYKDPESGEWYIGAKIVIPDMKGKTEAQKWGAGMTYARRYCCHNCYGLACSDDVDIENYTQPVDKSVEKSGSSDKILAINRCKTQAELMEVWGKMTTTEQAAYKWLFTRRKEELNS